jgi:hypothetical protein
MTRPVQPQPLLVMTVVLVDDEIAAPPPTMPTEG